MGDAFSVPFILSWRRIMEYVIMQLNKKNQKEEEKLFKKRLLDRKLHENWTESLFIYIYIYQSGLVIVCIYSRFLIIKARPKKYFFPSFPKNKIHLSKHHTHITLILMSDSSPTTLRQIPASFLKIRSLEVRSYRVNRAKNNTYFANQREDIFYLPHLLPP